MSIYFLGDFIRMSSIDYELEGSPKVYCPRIKSKKHCYHGWSDLCGECMFSYRNNKHFSSLMTRLYGYCFLSFLFMMIVFFLLMFWIGLY
jgi:hypothetical protein